jgi:carbon-monoxide dehydrogenase medium subunit
VPLRLDAVAQGMHGKPFEAATVRDAIRATLAGIDALEDMHASAAYRRRVAVTLAMRAIDDALTDATRRA